MTSPRPRILLVDDDPSIRMVTEATLSVLGEFDVTSVSSGEDALKVCHEQTFDLVLIDVMMPKLDGPATIRSLETHNLLGETPFVFLTAKVHGDLAKLSATGAAEVLAKPFDPEALVADIKTVIGGRG